MRIMENMIDFKTANFIQYALSQGKNLNEVLTNPIALSKEMGTKLGSLEIEQLKSLNENPVKNQLDLLSPDSKIFVKEVLKDGRFVLDWKDKPGEVAHKLGLTISPDTEDELKKINLEDFLDPNIDPVGGPKIVIITVAIAVVLGGSSIGDEQLPVLDFSNVEKL